MARRTPAKARRSARRKPLARWDASGLETSYANACALHSSREAVELYFGIDRSLTRRIVIAPAMAKRLAAALARVVRDYDLEFSSEKRKRG